MDEPSPREPKDRPGETLGALVEAVPAVIYEAEPGAGGAWHYVSGHLHTLLGY